MKNKQPLWSAADLTDADILEIKDILKELCLASEGDENSCDVIRYRVDYQLWLCFEVIPHGVSITLSTDSDEAGYPRGIIYAYSELAWDYIYSQVVEDDSNSEIYPCDIDIAGECPYDYKPCSDCKGVTIEEESSTYMTKEDILSLFKRLACSQGYYGRLLESLTEEGLQYLEDQHFKDSLDVILFIEG